MPKGKFEVEFTAEPSFKVFQERFSKCVGNFKAVAGVEANLSNLTKLSGWKYRVDFESKLKCDGVLGFINLAIKKTIPEQEGFAAAQDELARIEEAEAYQPTGDYVQDLLATIELSTSRFTTRLHSCGL